MGRQLNLKIVSAAVVGAFALMPVVGHANDNAKGTMADRTNATSLTGATNMGTSPMGTNRMYSDRENYKPWSNEKDVLKNLLKNGQDKAAYAKTLTDNGYQITSINADKPDYVEYEVVKGGNSYEVQIGLDKTSKLGNKVDVDANMWRADSTKMAMRGDKVDRVAPYVATNERFSDRNRMKAWTGEKERLEKALKPGQDKGAYAAALKKQGYQITSTNDSEKDYVEYEVVKGDNSFEVQIDFANGKGKEVDVTTNMWQTEATEKALERHARK